MKGGTFLVIVRKIHSNEAKRVREFWALAFESSLDCAKTPEEFIAELIKMPKNRDHQDWQEQWAAFDDDDKTMLSTFIAHPFTVSFDGHAVGMTGIGGVSTLPQYRRRGGIRACFEKALPEMAEAGAVFSYLYPFSTAYYRKFGYELGCDRILWRLKLEGIPRFAAQGECLLLEPGQDLTDNLMAVDSVWYSRYNMAVRPEAIDYQWVKAANPFKDKEYTYLYLNAAKEPMGYMTFTPEASTRDLVCKRFAFTCAEGFEGLLNLLCSLKADHAHARFYLPMDVDLSSYFPEWSFGMVERRQESFGMVRVLNVEKALSLAHMRGEGQLNIAVSDAQIASNNDIFTVAFAPNQPNHVTRTQAQPDVSMPISAFSRMLLGRCDLNAYPALTDVTLHCDAEKAARVFYRKPLYISTYF